MGSQTQWVHERIRNRFTHSRTVLVTADTIWIQWVRYRYKYQVACTLQY